MRLTDTMTGGVTSESTGVKKKGGKLGVANWGMAIKVLTQYSDPIPSIVREITSNAFDAHREAASITSLRDDQLTNSSSDPFPGKGYLESDIEYLRETFADWQDQPVRVILQDENLLTGTQRAFKVQDFGIGLSEERVEKVFTVLLESTKRGSNNEHGAFGLGAKSPLAYADLFKVQTVWRNTRSTYVIYKTEDGPSYELIEQEFTTDSNGTIIEVPIANKVDFESFSHAIKQQLAYFEGIEYHGLTVGDTTVYRGNHYLYRKDSPFDKMHIVIEGVVYPLNGGVVGIYSMDGIDCNLGLRFDIGELDIVWNRENLEYTDRTKIAIRNRLRQLKVELQELWDKQFNHIDSMQQFAEAFLYHRANSLAIAPEVILEKAHNLINMSVFYPKYPSLRSFSQDLLFMYEIHKLIAWGNINTGMSRGLLLQLRIDKEHLYLSEKKYSRKKNEYISHTRGSIFRIIKKSQWYDVDDIDTSVLSKIFTGKTGLHYADHVVDYEIRPFLKEVIEWFESGVHNYDEVVPDKRWSLERLKRSGKYNSKQKKKREDGVAIPCKFLLVDEEGEMSWAREDLDLNILENDALFIYGFAADDELLKGIAPLFHNCSRYTTKRKKMMETDEILSFPLTLDRKVCNIVKISMSNLSYFKQSKKKHIYIGTLLKSKSVLTRRYITALKMIELMPDGVDRLNTDVMKLAAPRIAKAAEFVLAYTRTYAQNHFSDRYIHPDEYNHKIYQARREISKVEEGMMEILQKTGGWDKDAIAQFNEVRAFIKHFPMVQYIDLHKVLPEDLRAYFRGKGSENPMILHKLHLKRKRAQA